MKKNYLLLLCTMAICSCSNAPIPWQVKQQEQYTDTHKGYADAATLRYAVDHQISPDSAIVLHNQHQW